jgi:precorrin-6y C5,15-methyltransferase (decarboxylating) CbiE subunit
MAGFVRRDSAMAVTEKIAIVGCGPGARECLTLEALAAIEGAAALIGSARLLSLFPALDTERVAVRGYRDETINAIEQAILQHPGKRIAVLVTGDPGLASLANAVIEHFGVEFCRVLPGISSVQVAFARAGLSWEGARILSAHAATPTLDFDTLAAEEKIAILTGNAASTSWIAALAHHLGEPWRIIVAQDLTLPNERVFEVHADQLEQLPQPLRAVILFSRKRKA